MTTAEHLFRLTLVLTALCAAAQQAGADPWLDLRRHEAQSEGAPDRRPAGAARDAAQASAPVAGTSRPTRLHGRLPPAEEEPETRASRSPAGRDPGRRGRPAANGGHPAVGGGVEDQSRPDGASHRPEFLADGAPRTDAGPAGADRRQSGGDGGPSPRLGRAARRQKREAPPAEDEDDVSMGTEKRWELFIGATIISNGLGVFLVLLIKGVVYRAKLNRLRRRERRKSRHHRKHHHGKKRHSGSSSRSGSGSKSSKSRSRSGSSSGGSSSSAGKKPKESLVGDVKRRLGLKRKEKTKKEKPDADDEEEKGKKEADKTSKGKKKADKKSKGKKKGADKPASGANSDDETGESKTKAGEKPE